MKISIKQITYKRRKNTGIILKVNEDLTVSISATPNINKTHINNFLETNKDKILKLIEKKSLTIHKRKDILSSHNKEILFLGNWHSIIFETSDTIYNEKEGCFYINPNFCDIDIEKIRVAIYKTYAKDYFYNELLKLEKITNIQCNNFKVTSANTRWGSFNSRSNMCLSFRLLSAPIETIDYVICHELCHKIHLNHSKKFYELLYSFFPDYKLHDKWLKENSIFSKDIKR